MRLISRVGEWVKTPSPRLYAMRLRINLIWWGAYCNETTILHALSILAPNAPRSWSSWKPSWALSDSAGSLAAENRSAMDCLNLESHAKCLSLVSTFALDESRKSPGCLDFEVIRAALERREARMVILAEGSGWTHGLSFDFIAYSVTRYNYQSWYS